MIKRQSGQKQDPKQNDKKNSKNQDQKDNHKLKPGDISKDRLENLLDAVNNEEKKIQDKVKSQKSKENQFKPKRLVIQKPHFKMKKFILHFYNFQDFLLRGSVRDSQ